MTNNVNNQAVIYSCLPLREEDKLVLAILRDKHKLIVLNTLVESAEDYSIYKPQPLYNKLLRLIPDDKIKHILTLSFNHLFTCNVYMVMIELQTIKALDVIIHTPTYSISMDSPISALYHYNNKRLGVLRKLAADAAKLRGSILGRPKVKVSITELQQMIQQLGSINKAAKALGISHHTATRLLRAEKRYSTT